MTNIDDVFAAIPDTQAITVDDSVDFVIDSNLRVISIPVRGVVLGVEGDKDVNRVTFLMPKMYKGVDLSTFQIRVNYANANGEKSFFKVTETSVVDDQIRFIWVVSADAVAYKGDVEFVVRFVKLNGSTVVQELNTTLANAKSLIGLSVDSEITPVQREDLLAHFYNEIDTYSEQKKNEILNSIPSDYTNLEKNVDELKQDIANTNDVLNIDEKEGKVQSVAGWQNVVIVKKKVHAGKTYKVDITLDSAPTNSAYIYIKAKEAALKTYQVQGLTSVSYERKANTEEEWSVEITAQDYTGFVTAKIYNEAPNSIKKINNDIIQVQRDISNQVSLTKRTLYDLFEIVHGGVVEFEIGAAKYRVATKDIIYFPDDVVATVFDGFRVSVVTYNSFSPSEYNFLGWKTGSTIIKKGFARIQIARVYESQSEIADIEEYSKSVSLEYAKIIELTPNRNVLFYALRKGIYFSHIDVNYYDGLIIPSQSIFDIRRAKRLGFGMIELNARKTSDGVFYAFHGHQNRFGDAFHSVNGSDISNINVSSVTSEYIQNNIRYNSKYEKYRTAPTTLENALIECKKNEIIPLVEYSNGIMDLINSIMGVDNYLIGTYENDRTPDLKNCVCVSWITGTAEQVIEKAEKSKAPYVCGINVTNAMYNNYTERDWKNFINKIHTAGYFVSCSYQKPVLGTKLLNSGIDIMASHGEINELENGNIFDFESDVNFSNFTTNGEKVNGVLNLTPGQTVKPTGINDAVFLGGASLHIIFNGKIHVKMGIIDSDFESDGSKDVWLSSFYQESAPTFEITAIDKSNILELSYKASRM